jgi:hypothetical protein
MALGTVDFNTFDGGITDFYIDCPPNQYKEAENFLITADKSIETRPGSVFFLDDVQVPIASRIGSIINLKEQYLFVQSSRKLYEVNSAWNAVSGANDAFASATSTSSFVSTTEWNYQLFLTSDDLTSKPAKVYKDDTNTTRIRTAGLPSLGTTTVSIATPGSQVSYIWALHLVFTYKVGSSQIEYVDLGPVTYATDTSNSTISGGNIATLTLPTLTNGGAGTNDNYDTANLKIWIYRTLANGQVPYYVDEVSLGTATYDDDTTDSELEDSLNVVYNVASRDNDPPPLAKFVHSTDDYCYWANVLEDDGVHRPYRVRQSKVSDPDSCPKGFFVDVDAEIVGLCSFGSRPLVFCNGPIYRIDGSFDDAGRGELVPQKINEKVSCVGHNSIVQTEYGVFWIAPTGAYFTDGYSVTPISTHLPNSFKRWLVEANYKKIYGAYDAYEKRIWWAFGQEANENDSAIILDLKFGISKNMPFTTAAGNSFAPAALCFFQKNMIRGHIGGYLFQHDDLVFTEPKVDGAASPDDWTVETLMWDFISGATSVGTRAMRKIFPRLILQAKNESNLSLAINGINDDGRSNLPCNGVIFRSNIVWGDDDTIWGDADLRWSYDGIIEAQRRFSAGGLRASYKQVQFTNSFVDIADTETYGQVTVDSSAKTAVLNDASHTWSIYAIDYYISFSYDNYEKIYKVESRSDTTLGLNDDLGSLPNGSYDFKMTGYRKNEKFSLVSYSLIYNTFSLSQDPSNVANTNVGPNGGQ